MTTATTNISDSLRWFFIGVFILAGSFWLNQVSTRPTASSLLRGHSNGFYGGPVVDEYAAPQPGAYKALVSTPLSYTLNVPPSAQRIKVVFRYRCATACPSVWLDIPSVPLAIPIRILLQHDVLKNFRYPSVSSQGMTLFQKKVTYGSVEEFLSKPPITGSIYSEGSLGQLFPGVGRRYTPLEEAFGVMTAPDYILTSYLKPRIFPDDWYEFGRIIDIRGAERSANGSIQLGIFGGPGEVKLDLTDPVLSIVP